MISMTKNNTKQTTTTNPPPAGLELGTSGSEVWRLTDWATEDQLLALANETI